jgi:FkbM family methyltransferase
MKLRPKNMIGLHRRSRQQAKLYSTFIKPGDIVFDVGANIGNRVDALRGCGAKVICVEPQPDCVQYLRSVYSGDNGVIILQCAAGDKTCQLPLRRARPLDPVASMSDEFILQTDRSGRFRKRPYVDTLEVEVIELEVLIKRFGKPSFIKIDVEGFEERVLGGIATHVCALSVEWTPEMPEHAEKCMKRCEALGLTNFHISFNESMRFCHPRAISRQEMGILIAALATDAALCGDIYAFDHPLERVR